MIIDVNTNEIDFHNIDRGDILMMANGAVWLVVNDDIYFRGVDLTNNRVEDYENFFPTPYGLCLHLQATEECKIIRHITGSDLLLTIVE